MTDDAPVGDPIDLDVLLACIPDESSEGLPADEIRELYAQQRPSFSEQDFDAALEGLAGDRVRTTTKRSWGVNVPLYRRA
jgi:hypothetical protein